MKQSQNIEQLVQKIYPSEIQVKRVLKEINNLSELDNTEYKISLENFSLGLKIRIELTTTVLNAH